MRTIQLPIEVKLLKDEITSKITSGANSLGEIPFYPKTDACCNLEVHKAWKEYLDPIILNIVKDVISIIGRKLEFSIHALEKRINIWNSVYEIREKYSAYNTRKGLNHLPSILHKEDRDITFICMREFFHIENAYNYNGVEYIDRHYVKKIQTLYQKDSLIKLKLLIAENILTWIKLPELIGKDCEKGGYSLLKREAAIFVTL